MTAAREADWPNDEARVTELRWNALRHQANRVGVDGELRGYSVQVRFWERGGGESRAIGYISSVSMFAIRVAVLKRLGGGFRTVPLGRVITIERAPRIEMPGTKS